MPSFYKKTPELEAEVDLVYRTPLPAPYSDEEIRHLLDKITSSTPVDPLTLQVTRKRVIFRKSTDTKPTATFNRKDLVNFNQMSESDCIIMARKLKRRKQELLLIRFIEPNGLKRFRNIFNCYATNRMPREPSLPPQQSMQEVPAIQRQATGELELQTPMMSSSGPTTLVYVKKQVVPKAMRETMQNRSQSEPRVTKSQGKQRFSSPELYVVKRVKCSKDGGRREEYSRVTIYNITSKASSDISDCSSMSLTYSPPPSSAAS
ncbi:expressed conserved protein [Echinococcus multilocularis]|uniref:Expressed conserved protein n=1 Tax=Echinococcus multilocularis TaxID=6211 RepID=A0A068YBT9_ECHMU|nr:expressed conserved protein [Echinococcus multilocularis]